MYQYFFANEKYQVNQPTHRPPIFSNFIIKLLMRFQLFCILFLVLFLQTATALHGQNKINLNVKRASLEQILQQVRAQTGYDYVIRPEHNKSFSALTINLNDLELKEVLGLCFQGQSLGFIVRNNTIIVTDQQQQRTINGIVTDTQQKPLAGATVRIKDSDNLTRTNGKGIFVLSNVPNDAILEISYLGYELRQIDLSGTSVSNLGPLFVLKQQISALDEVSVMANTGYQKLDPSKATGSLVVIDDKKIQESPALSLIERLEGQIPGVQFDTRTNSILVRSPNTFSSTSSTPLIVIDGFPAMEQQLSSNPTGSGNRLSATSTSAGILNNFNPDDIASITVLKDAAAASIWGSRAANGVIVIETKADKMGKNSINFSSTLGTSAPPNLHNLRSMNAAEYIDFEKELFDNNFFYDPASGWRAPNRSDAIMTMFRTKRGEISLAEQNSILNQLGQVDNRQQIRDQLLQAAQSQQYNLSFNGAVQGARYYASAVYSKDRPIYRENDANNMSLTFNVENNYFNNKLKVSLGLNHTIQKSKVNSAAIGAISPGPFGLTPYNLLLHQNGNSISRYYAFTPEVTQQRFESQGYLPWSYNHIDELNLSNDRYDNNLTRFTGQLVYHPLSWLNASLSGSYQKSLRNMESLRDRDSYEMRDLINSGTTVSSTGKLVYGVPLGGKYVTSNNKTDDYSLRFQLDGSKKFNNIHQIDVFAGSEIRQSQTMGYLQTRYGFDKDTYQSTVINPTVPYKDIYGGNKTLNIQDAPINIDRIRYLSYYANAGYTLLEKYFLTSSLRFDDATIIGVDRSKRAKPFWSTGLRWDLHKEDFMRALPWINALSWRGSIGTGGSVPRDGTSYTLYSASITDFYTQLPTGSISIPANQLLGWETTRTFNTGMDITALNNRLTVNLDYYTKRSYGIVASVPYNSTYGWSTLSFNTSNMKSHGIDLSIQGQLIQRANWKWNSAFNLAYSNNEVTDDRFPNTLKTPGETSTPIEGYPIDQIFAYHWAGLDDKGRSLIRDGKGNILDSETSTDEFRPTDLRYMGRMSAPYFGGWTNTVSYKNFTLTARMTMKLGHKVRWKEVNGTQYPTDIAGFDGYLPNSKALIDRWRKPGDEAHTDIPGVINTNLNSIQRFEYANINVLDASHIRLQMLALNYSFPASILGNNKAIKTLSIGATATNLGLFWKKTDRDIDPDYMFDGSYGSMPPVTSYVFRINMGF